MTSEDIIDFVQTKLQINLSERQIKIFKFILENEGNDGTYDVFLTSENVNYKNETKDNKLKAQNSLTKELNFKIYKPIKKKLGIQFRRETAKKKIVEAIKKFKENSSQEVDQPENQELIPSNGQLDDPYYERTEKAIEAINDLRKNDNVILIHGFHGIGKKTLARDYFKANNYHEENIIEFSASGYSKLNSLIKFLSNELKSSKTLTEEDDVIRELKNRKIGILIKDFHEILTPQGTFKSDYSFYINFLRKICDQKDFNSLVIITSLVEFKGNLDIKQYNFDNFKISIHKKAWKNYFQQENIAFNDENLDKLCEFYNGNALAMTTVLSYIQDSFNGDFNNYFNSVYTKETKTISLEDKIANLINTTLDDLNTYNEKAYKILCKMSYFSYIYLTKITETEVNLLVIEDNENEIKNSLLFLRDYPLVNFKNTEFNLIPMVRQEIRKRLTTENINISKINENIEKYLTEEIQQNKLKYPSNLPDYVLELFYNLYEQEEYKKAYEMLQMTVNKDKNNPEPLYRIMRLWGFSERLIECFEKLKNKLDGVDNAHLLGSIAVSYCYLDTYPKAIEILNELKEILENNNEYEYQRLYPDLLRYLSHSFCLKGNLEDDLAEAKKHAENGLEKLKDIENYLEKNPIDKYNEQKNYPHYLTSVKSLVHQSLAYIYYSQKDYDKSLKEVETAIKYATIKNHNSEILLHREIGVSLAVKALTLCEQNKIGEAIKTIDKAIKNLETIQDILELMYAKLYKINFLIKQEEIETAKNLFESFEKDYNKVFQPSSMVEQIKEIKDKLQN